MIYWECIQKYISNILIPLDSTEFFVFAQFAVSISMDAYP